MTERLSMIFFRLKEEIKMGFITIAEVRKSLRKECFYLGLFVVASGFIRTRRNGFIR
jgi:hypothetical protein